MKWTCNHCEESTAEKVRPELWRALFLKRLIRAGYPAEGAGLEFWDYWLIGLIEESIDERFGKSGD